jgi:hypothetical protein
LSPLKLPVKLKITTHECGATNAYWGGRAKGLSLCYEWFDFAKRVAPREATPEGYTRDDAITGMFLQVTFHELGHGMFDIYDIPVLRPRGRCRRPDGRLHHVPVRLRRRASDHAGRGLCLAKAIRGGGRMAALTLFR